MVTRLAKLKGFDNVLAGRDLLNILKDGHVYSLTEVMGVVMITDLGEHAIKHEGSDIAGIFMDGAHCLTKEEFEKQNKGD